MSDQPDSRVIPAKATSHAFNSRDAIQYFPNDRPNIIYDEALRTQLIDINLANANQRKLVWLKTPKGKFVIEFNRADATSAIIGMYFCKECGEPFERISDIGTHTRSVHDNKATLAKKLQDAKDEQNEKELTRIALLEHQAAQPQG